MFVCEVSGLQISLERAYDVPSISVRLYRPAMLHDDGLCWGMLEMQIKLYNPKCSCNLNALVYLKYILSPVMFSKYIWF